MDVHNDEWTNGWIDRRKIVGWIDGEKRKAEQMVGWANGWMDQ